MQNKITGFLLHLNQVQRIRSLLDIYSKSSM